jgi:3-phenylpropionate/trans-cinnamate dioxygenase ferredoxin reductase subunit
MAETQYVIVGGGLAAASAVEGIRELDKSGPITVLAVERELPYHRPPLSKSFLAGKDTVEAVRVHEASWYRDNKVRVRLGQTAKSVHIGRQGIALENGERVTYDRLLIATGSSARKLAVPGSELPGILYLRSLADSYALRTALKPGTRLVIVGGGFVGMEVAATARHLGADVTVLEMGPVVYRAFASPEISAFFETVLQSQGVSVKTNKRVARFVAGVGRVVAVQTEDGEQVPADVVLVGVGSEPNTGWVATSGFAIERGALIVNVRLETPGKNVWAAGDVTRFPDPVTKQPRRLEHWGNALAQGKQAGRNMAGANEPFTAQAAFFSDLFDITLNVMGDTDHPERVELRGQVDPAMPKFTGLYTRGGRLTGALTVNLNAEDRAAEFDALQKHIAAGTMPN